MITILALTLSVVVVFIIVALIMIVNKLFDLSVKLEAINKSTHQIVMPTQMANNVFQDFNDEVKKSLKKTPEEYEAVQ